MRRDIDQIEERIREEMEAGKGTWPLSGIPVALTPPFRPLTWDPPLNKWPRIEEEKGRNPAPLNVWPRLVSQRLLFERDTKPGADARQALLEALSVLKGPIGFELVLATEPVIRIACRADEKDRLAQSVEAHFPGVTVENAGADWPPMSVRVGYGLSRSHLLPLQTKISPDPLTSLLLLRPLQPILLQVLFEPLDERWIQNLRWISRDPLDMQRSPFGDLPDLPKWVEEKVRSGLFAVALSAGAGKEEDFSHLDAFLVRFASAANRFIRLPGQLPEIALKERLPYRPGMVLSMDELAELLPFPMDKSALARLTEPFRTAPAPEPNGHPLVILGTNPHKGKRRLVGLSQDDLTRHMAIFGRTHSGKSNLLAHFASLPSGLCLIDFHGDLAEAYLRLLPGERVNETLYFNAGDEECPPAFNPLAGTGRRGDVLVSDMLIAFRRYFGKEFWGPRMEMVLRNALLALMHHPQELTLLDLQEFFLSTERRRSILAEVEDPAVQSFWRDYFPGLARGSVHPIVNKLDKLLSTAHLRSVLGRPDRLDIDGTVREGRALVVNLSRGVLGEAESELLAYLLVAKVHVALLSRAGVPPEERCLFALICDEFQCLGGTEGSSRVFASFFSEVRKFGGAVVVAAQYVQALDREVQAALFGNVGTLITFNVGVSDAASLAKELGSFDAEDILNLGVGEALVRMGRSRDAFNLRVPLRIVPREGSREAILERSRRHFGQAEPAGTDRRIGGNAVATGADPSGVTPVRSAARPERSALASPPEPGLSAEDHRFLARLRERPFTRVREAYAALGLSGRRGDALKRRLLEKGLLLELLARSAQGRQAKALLPTSEGLKALGASFKCGKGGLLHQFLQETLAEIARKMGYEVRLESPSPQGDGQVDLTLQKDDERIGVELCVSTKPEYEVGKLERNWEGFSWVILAFVDPSALRQAQEALAAQTSGGRGFEWVLCLVSEVEERLRVRSARSRESACSANVSRVPPQKIQGPEPEQKGPLP